MKNYTHASARLAVLAALVGSAAALRAATPVVEIDFNNALGQQSLASRGSAAATGSWRGETPPAFSTSDAPVNTAGFSGSFNGLADSYLTFGSLPALDGLSSFTITGWINPSSAQSNSVAARLVVYKGNLSQGDGIDFYLSSPGGAPGKLALGVDGTIVSNTTSMTANTWTFFAVTYDGTKTSNNVTFYTGSDTGSLASFTTTLDRGIVGTGLGAGTQFLTIGGAEVSATPATPVSISRNYTGLIDSIRIYGANAGSGGVLSAVEIDEIRLSTDAPSAIPEPGSFALLAGAAGLVSALWMRPRRRAAGRR